MDDARAINQYFTDTYFRNYKMYLYVFTKGETAVVNTVYAKSVFVLVLGNGGGSIDTRSTVPHLPTHLRSNAPQLGLVGIIPWTLHSDEEMLSLRLPRNTSRVRPYVPCPCPTRPCPVRCSPSAPW